MTYWKCPPSFPARPFKEAATVLLVQIVIKQRYGHSNGTCHSLANSWIRLAHRFNYLFQDLLYHFVFPME